MERLKALEIFKAVVDHGSFTKAADAAHVAVPSVSRAVQDLEALLGVQLFNRTTRKVSLTSVGLTVLEHATGVLDCYEDLARISNDIALDVSGDLRVEVSVLFGMSRLAPVLASFMREYPKVRVDTRLVDNSVETLGDLADLSIVVGRSAPSSYVARSLAATRLGIYASPSFLDSAGRPVHPDDVRRVAASFMATDPFIDGRVLGTQRAQRISHQLPERIDFRRGRRPRCGDRAGADRA
jgi:DNA-binding transcriptional LysR family regulator